MKLLSEVMSLNNIVFTIDYYIIVLNLLAIMWDLL